MTEFFPRSQQPNLQDLTVLMPPEDGSHNSGTQVESASSRAARYADALGGPVVATAAEGTTYTGESQEPDSRAKGIVSDAETSYKQNAGERVAMLKGKADDIATGLKAVPGHIKSVQEELPAARRSMSVIEEYLRRPLSEPAADDIQAAAMTLFGLTGVHERASRAIRKDYDDQTGTARTVADGLAAIADEAEIARTKMGREGAVYSKTSPGGLLIADHAEKFSADETIAVESAQLAKKVEHTLLNLGALKIMTGDDMATAEVQTLLNEIRMVGYDYDAASSEEILRSSFRKVERQIDEIEHAGTQTVEEVTHLQRDLAEIEASISQLAGSSLLAGL